MTEDRRLVVVTGGSRGIGAGIARVFGARGWDVLLTYREDRAAAEAVAEGLAAGGARAEVLRCDVADEAQVAALFEAADRFGAPLRALVNNAGVTGPRVRLEDLTAEVLRRVVEVNLVGAILCCREAVRRMSTRRGGAGGSIVTISSTATRLGSPNQWVHYAATKGAVDVLTAGLAREVGSEGIRVNAVAPGLTLTDPALEPQILARLETMRGEIPLDRAGTVEEVAEGVFWLCSDAAAYCTGAVLPIAGGR